MTVSLHMRSVTINQSFPLKDHQVGQPSVGRVLFEEAVRLGAAMHNPAICSLRYCIYVVYKNQPGDMVVHWYSALDSWERSTGFESCIFHSDLDVHCVIM